MSLAVYTMNCEAHCGRITAATPTEDGKAVELAIEQSDGTTASVHMPFAEYRVGAYYCVLMTDSDPAEVPFILSYIPFDKVMTPKGQS